MQVFNTLIDIPEALRGGIIAIGNFDGVHRGHQAVLNRVLEHARARNIPAGVLTFEPHPRRLFRPDDPPFRITPTAIKHRRLAESGIDFVCALPFDWEFASQSAEQFIAHILQGGLGARHIFVGQDFRFGQLRKGTPAMIQSSGIDVEIIAEAQDTQGQKLSSSAVREALQQGDIDTANAILGWEWEMEGVIFRGDRRGHQLGYPTANLLLGETLHPAYGIYATMVQIEGEDVWRPAATNIGIRPMFEVKQGQVEAHILNFEDRDLYDKTLRVRPVKRLRGEAKFESLEALIIQMGDDCRQALHILS